MLRFAQHKLGPLRLIRKHKYALLALVVWHFVFFFPTLFMQRVVSPNDVYFNFQPWSTYRTAPTQNSTINDPPTSYYTMLSLVRDEPHSFNWDPYVACGIPGWGSSSAASLTPFVFIPTKLLPLSLVYGGIIFLKLTAAFLFAYLWLREEHLGKRGAAIGAILFAASGAIAVRWLWQVTNATPLYPALLWIALRTARGKRVSLWSVAFIAMSYAVSGFPAAMAYGAWIAATYVIVRLVIERRFDIKRIALVGATVIASILAVFPLLMSFASLVKRTGYLATRVDAATKFFFVPRHLWLFIRPDMFGNPANHDWIGIRSYGLLNNYIELTVYCGILAIPLLLAGIANRRATMRWYWLVVLVVILGCMFGVTPIARAVGALPGFKYSVLTRLHFVLPIAVAYLAAAGAALVTRIRFGAMLAAAIVVFCAADLGVFAGRFYPYLDLQHATPGTTPIVRYLQAQPRPFRVAPFFDYLWPNSSELVRLEDVRSHFSSEERYRRLLARIDPSSTLNGSTIIQLDSRKFDFSDPLVGMLGIRYFVEHRTIDIIRWSIYSATKAGVPEHGVFHLDSGAAVARHVRVDAEPFWSIELPVSVDSTSSPAPRLFVSLIKGTKVVWSRAFTPDDIAALGKVYVPLRPFARLGDTVVLRVAARGMRCRLLQSATADVGDTPMFYGRVTTPIIFDRDFPDGRLFVNVAEVPRFRAVSRVRKMNDAQFLATKDVDFATEAIVTDATAPLPQASDASVMLLGYTDDEQHITVVAPAATFLASSEKLTPELGVTIDGHAVKPVEINMLFAGVEVPAGHHRVVFSRRVGRGWWWVSIVGFVLVFVLWALSRAQRGILGGTATR